MGRQKSNSLSLPPDFVHVEKILTSANVLKLQTLSTSQHLKIYFINPVESLDVFFLVNYLFSLGLDKLNVDFYTSDAILLKKASEGIYKKSEIEEYCLPQNLPLEQTWLKLVASDKMQIDPRLLLKIQFHWIESTEVNTLTDGHMVVKGPMFSDSYDKSEGSGILPCYKVDLILPI